MPEKTIPLSKGKSVFLFLGSLIFVVIGCWMYGLDADDFETKKHLAKVVKPLAVFTVLFFGSCALVVLRKALSSKPGLILDRSGFHDNSSGISNQFVPWSDVVSLDVVELNRNRMIRVSVNNPEKYLRLGNYVQRLIRSANHRLYGSPVFVVSTTLRVSFDDLFDEFVRYFENSKL